MTAQPPTIPAAFLEALGGLRDSDPPVEPENHIAVSWWQMQHTGTGRPWAWHPGARLFVEQSMPALLRCLARKKGLRLLPGETPGWTEFSDGEWWLQVTDAHADGHAFCSPDSERARRPGCSIVPALAFEMTLPESLAAVIGWAVQQ